MRHRQRGVKAAAFVVLLTILHRGGAQADLRLSIVDGDGKAVDGVAQSVDCVDWIENGDNSSATLGFQIAPSQKLHAELEALKDPRAHLYCGLDALLQRPAKEKGGRYLYALSLSKKELACFKGSFPAEEKCSSPIADPSPSPPSPNDFVEFQRRFAQTIHEADVATASSLSHFPLVNKVYREPRRKAREAFETSFKEFFAGFEGCLRDEKPARAEEDKALWFINCDGNVFYFKKSKDDWKYAGYENINE